MAVLIAPEEEKCNKVNLKSAVWMLTNRLFCDTMLIVVFILDLVLDVEIKAQALIG